MLWRMRLQWRADALQLYDVTGARARSSISVPPTSAAKTTSPTATVAAAAARVRVCICCRALDGTRPRPTPSSVRAGWEWPRPETMRSCGIGNGAASKLVRPAPEGRVARRGNSVRRTTPVRSRARRARSCRREPRCSVLAAGAATVWLRGMRCTRRGGSCSNGGRTRREGN